MPSLLELPFELLEQIFEQLDSSSLLALRGVNKITKQLSQDALINKFEDNKLFHQVQVFETGKDVIQICFCFFLCRDSQRSLYFSKIYFVFAMNYINGPKFFYNERDKMSTTLSASETVSLFERLSPIMADVLCNSFVFSPSTPQVLSLTSTFFDGKTTNVKALEYADTEESRDFLLHLIKKFHKTTIILEGKSTRKIVYSRPMTRLITEMNGDASVLSTLIADPTKSFTRLFSSQPAPGGLYHVPQHITRMGIRERNDWFKAPLHYDHSFPLVRDNGSNAYFSIEEIYVLH